MSTESGYSNVKKWGPNQHKTIHSLGSSRYGQHVVMKSLAEKNALPIAIVSTQIDPKIPEKYILLEIPAHGANVGDIVRFYSGVNLSAEIEIVKVADADHVWVYRVLSTDPQVGDTVKIMFYVTSKSDAEGNVNFSPGPTTFIKDNASATVTEDSTDPTLNKGLPVLPAFYKNGVQVTVNEDTVTPAQSNPFPVKLMGLTGDVNITAGDLNVSTNSTNDSMAIGDSVTGEKAEVSANTDGTTMALKVKDDDANTALGAVKTAVESLAVVDFATETTLAGVAKEVTLDAVKTAVEALALMDFATEVTLDEVNSALDFLGLTVGQDGNIAPTRGIQVGGEDGNGDFQNFRTNTAGELLVSFGAAGFATETTLNAIKTFLQTTFNLDFGASAGATRVAAQIGNATGAADFGDGASGAQVLRVSANLKRNGNDLAYKNGAADANTLRVTSASDSPEVVAIGSKADAAAVNTTDPNSVISLLKGQMALLNAMFSQAASGLIETVTQVCTAATVTTINKPLAATKMMICNNADPTNANPIRWTKDTDAVDPSNTNGVLLVPTAPMVMMPASNIKVWALEGNASVSVIWFY